MQELGEVDEKYLRKAKSQKANECAFETSESNLSVFIEAN